MTADSKPPRDGGPAFPVVFGNIAVKGMSLRDWFAGQALAGMATGRDWSTSRGDDMDLLAQQVLVIADAMLAARIVPEAADE